ncbi:uncharacterized protein LOC128556099 [Mercenaria mercenaria]|uniref:uncharacterized protein LOC128556099 n=1 Tax=Mercenaria mercenaria TaxID=6596 RepID=UPI00234F8CF4|nr:uncharacterized protein LOC128556099 [Mercenaria mercenaria]
MALRNQPLKSQKQKISVWQRDYEKKPTYMEVSLKAPPVSRDKEDEGKPYFVDIPSPDQFVNCKIHSTCVVALYVKSTIKVVDVHVTESYIDRYQLGPIQIVIHKGETVYQTDLSFEHSLHGKEQICFVAKNKNGVESENVCIQSKIEPPNPCVSAPCLNSATCVMETDTGGFTCRCLSGFSGKTCQISY